MDRLRRRYPPRTWNRQATERDGKGNCLVWIAKRHIQDAYIDQSDLLPQLLIYPSVDSMVEKAIEGNKVYEPQTNLLVPFSSHSDALLAQLPLQHGLTRHHFNLLLDVLLDPSFCPADVSLKSSTDVDMRISDYRRTLGGNRNRVGQIGYPEPVGMPSVVFDLVIHKIIEEMSHFSHEADATPNVSEAPAIPQIQPANLKDMCLVHRSWTAPVQRVLRRRVVLRSWDSLRDFARSPACGTGVREFAYKIGKSFVCTFFHEVSVAKEHWGTLASVLSRLTNLRFLSLRIESAHFAELSGLDLVLQAIGTLESLEAVSKLHNLRFLSVCNWTCSRVKREIDEHLMPENILELTPPSRLKTLHFRDGYLTVPPKYLSWFFRPRGSYCLENLDLNITFSRPLPPFVPNDARVDASHLIEALSPLLPCLSFLAIKLFYLDTSSAAVTAAHDTDLQAVLSRAHALRRVRLHKLRAGGAGPGVLPLVLPAALEELHMHYTYSAVNWRTQDRRLHATLAAGALPHLRRILLTTGEVDPAVGSNGFAVSTLDLPKTREFCESRGVEIMSCNNVYLNQYVVDELS
ncbi:hypothetical protein DFH11DRAFT_1747182 [Phellopilus nigrolimitatus]|nr:hypothetical protein DFH11DRAFT_1747182 [Phellopilus nigrolimitatus]